jgi:1-acyl-sn-glycerol-3-phosphate acyltransferase
VARIALLAGAPVVPVAVIGCEAIGREVFTFKRRPGVRVCYGRPLLLEGDAENVADVERWTTAVMGALAALLPEERRGYYGEG